jgi:hypothetical protein
MNQNFKTKTGTEPGRIYYKNPKTGEVQSTGTGYNLTLSAFSIVWGIPLFIKKLHSWGYIYLTFMSVYLLLYPQFKNREFGAIIVFILFAGGLSTYLGVKGNRLLAINYLENGWRLQNPSDKEVIEVLKKWGLEIK